MRSIDKSVWGPMIKQTHDPQSSQRQVLNEILAKNANTAFGKEHDFDLIQSYEDYRAAVPIYTYEEFRPYIEAQERTKECRLTIEQPVAYAQTSGTTGVPKNIPILESTIGVLSRHQQLTTFAQYQGLPTIFDGKILVLSSARAEGALETGTPYGSMSGFLHELLPDFIRDKAVLPPEVLRIEEYDRKYIAIAAHALAEPNLSLIATANPSTVIKLFDVIRENLAVLIELLPLKDKPVFHVNIPMPHPQPSRITELEKFLEQQAHLTLGSFWPGLRALVTWTGGSCAALLPRVQALLPPKTEVIEMGYLSSELAGSVNIDVRSNRCIPTFYDNFFEFVEEGNWEDDDAPVLTLAQVEEGKRYYVIVTTRNGLYRYCMNDIIEVTGWFNQTPTIQFVQKGKGVTNLTGEKLYEHHVTTAVEAIRQEYGIAFGFFLMLADPVRLEYTMCIEHPVLNEGVMHRLDSQLSMLNIEYKVKRESGRLQPLKVLYVKDGTSESYKRHCLAEGQREAQYKVVRLQYVKDCSFDFYSYAR